METKLTEQESLKIIQEMIATSKNKIKNNSFFYLLWGWLVLIASLSHYLLLRINIHYEYAYLPWPVLMLSGMVVSVIAGIRIGKREKVISHFDNMMMFLWWGFFFTLIVIMLMTSFQKITWTTTYPLIIALYGLGTFVSGGVLRFKPLIFGGISSWIISILTFFIEPINILLMMALSIIIAYLIPGYLLKYKEK
jgi:hypothetical protein